MAQAEATPRRTDDVPPQSTKAVRVSAGTLLIEERKTLRAVKSDIRTHGKVAVADATYLDDGRPEPDRKRAALLLLLLGASQRMAHALGHTLRDRRQATRLRAAARASIEIGVALGHEVRIEPIVHARIAEDSVRAQSAAEILAASWRANAMAEVTAVMQAGGNPYRAIGQATGRAEARAGRTAVTETVQAYNDEHRRSAEEWLEGADIDTARMLVRRWDAILDARVCPNCRAMDGELTLIGASFAGGMEPPAHVFCRCISTIVSVTRQ